MINAMRVLWTPLSATPLLWLVVTLAAYVAGRSIQSIFKGSPYASPVLIAIIIVGTVLLMTRTSYDSYFMGAQFINFLLGPVTVALAIPLAENFTLIWRNLSSIGLALPAGSLTSVISGVGIVWALGGTRDVALSMAPKAVTTPIAMAVSTEIGGVPALTAALAILGGIVAAIVGRQMLRQFKIEDLRAHGLAAGVAGSGVAAAQIAAVDEAGAAFAALGIGLNGLLTAILVPVLAALWH
jgi:putative effector of murein hydrolase